MIFTEAHIDQIRSGEKTATRRRWDQRRATPGTTYRVTTGEDMFIPRSECDCFIRAVDVYQQSLGEMSETDVQPRAIMQPLRGSRTRGVRSTVDGIQVRPSGSSSSSTRVILTHTRTNEERVTLQS